MRVVVEADRGRPITYNDKGSPVAFDGSKFQSEWQGGGDFAALRLYRAHHPGARIYSVIHRGRTVWMTLKQFAIWREVLKYHKRGQRTTLKTIATIVGASRSTVSRFLRRLDLWRFIDVATIVGRGGGTYVFTNANPYVDETMWTAGANITMSSRQKARDILAARIKNEARARLKPLLATYRIPRPAWWQRDVLALTLQLGGDAAVRLIGNTDATLKRNAKKGARYL